MNLFPFLYGKLRLPWLHRHPGVAPCQGPRMCHEGARWSERVPALGSSHPGRIPPSRVPCVQLEKAKMKPCNLPYLSHPTAIFLNMMSTCVWFNMIQHISKIKKSFMIYINIVIPFTFRPISSMTLPGSALPPAPSGTLPDYQAMPAMPGVITEAAHQAQRPSAFADPKKWSQLNPRDVGDIGRST